MKEDIGYSVKTLIINITWCNIVWVWMKSDTVNVRKVSDKNPDTLPLLSCPQSNRLWANSTKKLKSWHTAIAQLSIIEPSVGKFNKKIKILTHCHFSVVHNRTVWGRIQQNIKIDYLHLGKTFYIKILFTVGIRIMDIQTSEPLRIFNEGAELLIK